MELMKWRIAKQKLLFLRKLMEKEDSNICKRAVMNEIILGAKGLGHECKVLATTIGLPDVVHNQVSKVEIKNAILEHSRATTKDEVEASRKVGDRATEDEKHRNYLTYMTLPNSRIWMRVRARSIKGVKVNNKRSFINNLSCRFCDNNTEETQETQEHLEECRGCYYERRGQKMTDWSGKVIFWRRMTAKISAWGKGEGERDRLLLLGGTLT